MKLRQLTLQCIVAQISLTDRILKFSNPLCPYAYFQYVRMLFEHFYKEKESAIRVKVMMLLAELSQTANYDPVPLVDEVIAAMKREGLSHAS